MVDNRRSHFWLKVDLPDKNAQIQKKEKEDIVRRKKQEQSTQTLARQSLVDHRLDQWWIALWLWLIGRQCEQGQTDSK